MRALLAHRLSYACATYKLRGHATAESSGVRALCSKSSDAVDATLSDCEHMTLARLDTLQLLLHATGTSVVHRAHCYDRQHC
jgi:hypothetical protein